MRGEMIALILGMAVVTFLPRFLPMVLFTRWGIPDKVRLALEDLPVAILSAIVFPLLFFSGDGSFHLQPRVLIAAIPTFLFAWKVRSVWGSVLLGMAIYWGLEFVL
jgi:branched-subunit amino acid transport protein